MENERELPCHSDARFPEASNLSELKAPGFEGREDLGSREYDPPRFIDDADGC